MGKVTIIKGSLFDAPKGSILLHACNTQGLWGSGIAKSFADKFPAANKIYSSICELEGSNLLGTCLLIPDEDYVIGCLFTSNGFGGDVDPIDKILSSTKRALHYLFMLNINNETVHTCKINSGLFRVPWELTEKLLIDSEQDFIVYEY